MIRNIVNNNFLLIYVTIKSKASEAPRSGRLMAARMAVGGFGRDERLGLALASAMKRLMAVWSARIEVKTPRLRRCRIGIAVHR